jgi:DNA (cytosine-5)-methyltransferase 1
MVDHFDPEIWVFENVPGFARNYRGRFVNEVRNRLTDSGHIWHEMILKASDFGVPQNRKRFFMVGSRNRRILPLPQPTNAPQDDLFAMDLPAPVTLWEAISDLPNVGLGERTGIFEYERLPLHDYQRKMRLGSARVTNHTTQKHSARVLEKIRRVIPGEDMAIFLENYEENRVRYMGGYRRALKNVPSYTAYWTRGMTSIHPEADRFLSPRECARIQSFPDWVDFKGTTIENYRLVCNAVPPLLAEAWGKSISAELSVECKSYIEGERPA